jgi:hypothetical protein
MIIAGVDEAGYGPLLGPLIIGCCAFEIPDHTPADSLPCLWKRLSKMVSKKRSTSGKKLHINDSKMVYSPSAGLKELERSVLAILYAAGQDATDLEQLLSTVAKHVLPELDAYPWYRPPENETFPIEQAAMSVKIMANALRQEMQRSSTICVHFAARVVLEQQLNRQFAATRNKAAVLFSVTAIHLDHLLRTWGHHPMTIFCDRQGGREHYGSLLRLMFDEWNLEVLEERDGCSAYQLHRGQDCVRIIFREKAEAQCMSVALASMLSKYLREALMHRFNAFWSRQLPQIVPTAGYYTDGNRFLRDIELKRKELGIADDQLIRSR